MDTYLENHPELQLKDKDGVASPPRLDISRPEALTYYTSMVDEALKVWDTRTWHMGADEYMIGSSYPDYPQLQAAATAKFGATATPDDLFVDFINQVNAHVKAQGRSLRIWNDGLTGRNPARRTRARSAGSWTPGTGRSSCATRSRNCG
ncbi:family 20 glycosylhydrolase [Streptomyces sp. 2131.1]|uniref:family 20 glycosylhydrolase n=1 Tax=Streptomyces sp. 2131.1 TaxID=1855346 RepID=UPI000AE628BF|nr:family 20 glycosylhydrolase [Streptomyces sp. 2131.1]